MQSLRLNVWHRRLESEGGPHSWTAEYQFLDELAVALLVGEVAIGKQQVAPLEGIPDAGECLPGEIGRSCAGVEIVGREPAAFAEPETSAQADDAVPEFFLLRHRLPDWGNWPTGPASCQSAPAFTMR